MNDWQRKVIAENIIGFDFDKCRDRREWRSAVKVATERADRKRKASALEKATANGFLAGVSVENTDGSQKEIVKKVSSDGHLILEGRKGSFNICGWKVIS